MIRSYQLLVLLTSISIDLCGQKQTEFIAVETLANPLPADLYGQPLVHLKTHAIQKDNFSCGYHALFNAMALERAAQGGYYFEDNLRRWLGNQDLFQKVYSAVFQYTKQDKALDGAEIMAIAGNLVMGPRLISLFYTDKHELMIPALYAMVSYPLGTSAQEIENLLHAKRKAMVAERIIQILQELKKPCQTGHFVCNTGNHWILLSVITDLYGRAKLYFIGAWNEPLTEIVKKYVHDLLALVAQAGINV